MQEIKERDTVYHLLYECLEKGAFSNLVFDNKETTAFVRAAVYGTLSFCYSLDFVIRHVGGKDVHKMDSATRTIMRFGAWQIVCSEKVPNYAAVDTSVKLAYKYCKSSAGFINAILHKLADASEDELNLDNYKPEIATSLNPEIYGILKKCYGKDKAFSIGKSFLNSPRLTIRINITKTDKENITEALTDDGFNVIDDSFIPDCLTIETTEGSSIGQSLAFRRGEFFVQSEGAMLASILANPSKGDRILDCCSAPGGKATHVAELTNDECDILSLDINSSRLELIKENAERLGLKSINCMVSDSTELKTALSDKLETFDVVMADVPCSGLGLLGKKPDIRHTISYERILELLPKQKVILDNASAFVKPGGTLLYSTCTLNKAENELQVQEFLDSHSDFYAEDISGLLPANIIINEERRMDAQAGYITIYPDTDRCDGFFAARLRRRG